MLEHIKVRENILHANSIEMLDGTLVDKLTMFEKGHILISLREIHTIAVIDLEQEKVTWALTGMWNYQHEPSLLKNGNVLIFDNRGNNGKSKIIDGGTRNGHGADRCRIVQNSADGRPSGSCSTRAQRPFPHPTRSFPCPRAGNGSTAAS